MQDEKTGAWQTHSTFFGQFQLAPSVLLLLKRSLFRLTLCNLSPNPAPTRQKALQKIAITQRSLILHNLNDHRSCVHNWGSRESKCSLKKSQRAIRLTKVRLISNDHFNTDYPISLPVALNSTKLKAWSLFSPRMSQILVTRSHYTITNKQENPVVQKRVSTLSAANFSQTVLQKLFKDQLGEFANIRLQTFKNQAWFWRSLY